MDGFIEAMGSGTYEVWVFKADICCSCDFRRTNIPMGGSGSMNAMDIADAAMVSCAHIIINSREEYYKNFTVADALVRLF